MTEFHDTANEARIERYHEGYGMYLRGEGCPTDRERAEGWFDAMEARRVSVVMPRRPEGYYHVPAGTFD